MRNRIFIGEAAIKSVDTTKQKGAMSEFGFNDFNTKNYLYSHYLWYSPNIRKDESQREPDSSSVTDSTIQTLPYIKTAESRQSSGIILYS